MLIRATQLFGLCVSHNAPSRAALCATVYLTGHLTRSGQQVHGITTGYTHIPKKKHDPYRTPPKNYVQLLQHITRARQVLSLDMLVSQYGPKFDGVHVAAAMSVLPKLYQPPQTGSRLSTKKLKQRRAVPQKLLSQLQALATAQVPRLFAREVASITWALGRTRSLLPGDSGHNPATSTLVSAMLQRVCKDNGRMLYQAASGAEIAKMLHGIARLKLGQQQQRSVQQLCWLIQQKPERLHAKELAAAAWALSKIGPPGAAGDAALDAISQQAVALKLYLRPAAMCSLATACAHLKRRDEQLLGAVAEEALAQLKDFKPTNLAVLLWAFGRLNYHPGAELITAAAAAARAQLESFGAVELGLLLQGLTQLGGLDKQLLGDVAAGIAKEEAIALRPRDAVRILAAFVAAPDAGKVKDVDRMAELMAVALQSQVSLAAAHHITNLVVCFSKLPYSSPFLLRLLEEAAQRADEFSLGMWVRLLQSCDRLGYSGPAARDARLVEFYAAADKRLQRHLLGAAAPEQGAAEVGSSEQPQHQQHKPKQRRWGLLGGGAKEQQEQSADGKLKPPPPPQQGLHTLQFSAAVDVGKLLGDRGALSESSAMYLADVGCKLLADLPTRRLMLLLTAVTSRDRMAAIDDVRRLLVSAGSRLSDQDLSQESLTVLAGLSQPLGRAVSRNMLVAQGEQLLRGIYSHLLPLLERCDEQQLLMVWESMRRAGVEEAALQQQAEAVAAQHGWRLPSLDQGWHF